MDCSTGPPPGHPASAAAPRTAISSSAPGSTARRLGSAAPAWIGLACHAIAAICGLASTSAVSAAMPQSRSRSSDGRAATHGISASRTRLLPGAARIGRGPLAG